MVLGIERSVKISRPLLTRIKREHNIPFLAKYSFFSQVFLKVAIQIPRWWLQVAKYFKILTYIFDYPHVS